jgi:hypothetical protein
VFVQFTVIVVLPGTAAPVSDVPGVDGKVSVAAFTVHDAVMVIETARFAVAVPAWAVAGGNSAATMSAAVNIREALSMFNSPRYSC